MKFNKQLLAVGLVTAVTAGSLVGVSAASAQGSNNQSSIIDKIATRFNLNRDEVQAVFDEEHAARAAEMKTMHSEHLQDLVDDGKITAEQKTAIEAKMDELQTKREEMKEQDLTREERRTQMKAERDELKQWAEEQGIDMSLLRPEGIMGRNHGRGGGHGMHTMDDSSWDDSEDHSADTTDDTPSQTN